MRWSNYEVGLFSQVAFAFVGVFLYGQVADCHVSAYYVLEVAYVMAYLPVVNVCHPIFGLVGKFYQFELSVFKLSMN